MKKLPKVATLLAIGSVTAAGMAVTPAAAHSQRCPTGYTLTPVDATTSGADRNNNDFVCIDASGDVQDDHKSHAGGGKKKGGKK